MINKTYLQPKIQEQLRTNLHTPGFPQVTLFDVLQDYEKWQKQIAALYFKAEKKPTSHSYGLAEIPTSFQKFLNSDDFKDFCSSLLSQPVHSINAKVYRFSWQDYTVLSDDLKQNEGIEFIMDFTEYWHERAGGAVTYKDVQGNFVRFPIRANTLIIIKKGREVQRFVQYVNHLAEKKKRYLVMGKII